MDPILLTIGAAFLVVLSLFVSISKIKSSRSPNPPGPPQLPFLGNAFDIDITEPHITYTQWARKYGDLVFSRVLGQDYIIVNSEKVARTLSETRSAVYSDRPILSIYKFFGIDFATGLLPCGKTWRLQRKLHQAMRPALNIKYHALFMSHAISLVRNLLHHGAGFNVDTITKDFAAIAMLSLTYGHDIKSQDHPLVRMAQQLNDVVVKEATPQKAALLTTFPFVCYLPSWFPGLGFNEHAATCRKLAKELQEQPFENTKRQLAAGTAPQSILADFYINQEGIEDDEEFETSMKAAAATIYLAGAEATASVLHTFILAMILFPEVQERARAEINSVVGQDRLPTFEDRNSLPYIEAVICETLRWHPPLPLGMPHATNADDVYQGFHIPKGSIVIFNIWAMTRDHVNADQFDPGRHLLPNGELSPTARMTGNVTFGFGRRICSGRFFVEGLLWAAFAQMLATLRFSKAKDASGRTIDFDPVFTNGVASQPAPFPLSITGTERANLIVAM